MPKGLKIETRTGVTLLDSSWTAGVDCRMDCDASNTVENDDHDTNNAVENDEENNNSDDENENESDESDAGINDTCDILAETCDILAETIPEMSTNFENNENADFDFESDDENEAKIENDEVESDNAINNQNENEEIENNKTTNDENVSSPSPTNIRRSVRISKPTDRHGAYISHLQVTNEDNNFKCVPDVGKILVMVVNECKCSKKRLDDDRCSFASTYALRQCEKKFGSKAKDAIHEEMK